VPASHIVRRSWRSWSRGFRRSESTKISSTTGSAKGRDLLTDIQAGKITATYAKGLLGTAKSFVRHLWEREVLDSVRGEPRLQRRGTNHNANFVAY
jgi:hypothetical protein